MALGMPQQPSMGSSVPPPISTAQPALAQMHIGSRHGILPQEAYKKALVAELRHPESGRLRRRRERLSQAAEGQQERHGAGRGHGA